MDHPNLAPLIRLLAARRFWWAAPFLAPGLAAANPTGADVVSGSIDLSTPDASTLRIDQGSHSAAIDWQSFSIQSDEYVIFNQPSASSVVLNRVVGGSPSEIFGSLTANGRVFLINPQGILFAPGARVDVGALTASTLDISNEDFQAGRYLFSGASTAGVANAGRIAAGPGGFVVMLGDHVSNTGLIQAQLGSVVLASGSAVTLDLAGDGLISYAIDEAAISDRAGVENLGQIVADGGRVVMAARVARSLAATVVNNEGLVRAQSIVEGENGEIVLTGSGGDVVNAGTLDVSGTAAAPDAGKVRVTGDRDVTLASGSRILAVPAAGGEGGDVRAVAGGRLSYEKGAQISVGTALTRGGYVELSGGSIRVRDIVGLGRGGTLLLDPSFVTIGYGGDIDDSTLEAQIQNTPVGGRVIVAATHEVRVLDLASDLDGRDGRASYGGGLLLGIGNVSYGGNFVRGSGVGAGYGNIVFDDTSDGILVEGDLELAAGSGYGGIVAGHLDAGEDLKLVAAGSIRTQALHAGQSIKVLANNQDLSGPAADTITINGDVTADNSFVQLAAPGDINVYGDIAGALSDSGGELLAAVDVDGGRSVHVTGSVSGDSVSFCAGTSYCGNASAQPEAQDIAIGGNVTVTSPDRGAYFAANARGNVAIGGDILVAGQGPSGPSIAAGASIEITTRTGDIELGTSPGYGGNVTLIASQGTARLDLHAGSDYGSTGNLTVFGTVGATGGGGTFSYGFGLAQLDADRHTVEMNLSARENLHVYGDLTGSAVPVSISRDVHLDPAGPDFLDSFASNVESNIVANVAGYGVTLGNVSLTGTGGAEITIRGVAQVRTGAVSVHANAAQVNSYGAFYAGNDGAPSFGSHYFAGHGGDAEIEILTSAGGPSYASPSPGGEIVTGPLTATGPEAEVRIDGGRVTVGDDGGGSAVTVSASGTQASAYGSKDGVPFGFEVDSGPGELEIAAADSVAVLGRIYVSGIGGRGDEGWHSDGARVDIRTRTGDIVLGSAERPGDVTLNATGGNADLALSAGLDFTGASYADVMVYGGITAAGGGGEREGSFIPDGATVDLYARGNVAVTGDMNASATPQTVSIESSFANESSYGSSAGAGFGAHAHIRVEAGGNATLGNAAVTATGDAHVHVYAKDILIGAINVYANPATLDRSSFFSSAGGLDSRFTEHEEFGEARVDLGSAYRPAGHVQSGNIDARGPQAFVSVAADSADLGAGNGTAIYVAGNGGIADGSSSSNGDTHDFESRLGIGSLAVATYGDVSVYGSIGVSGFGDTTVGGGESDRAVAAENVVIGRGDALPVGASAIIATTAGNIALQSVTVTAYSGAAVLDAAAGGRSGGSPADLNIDGTVYVSGGGGSLDSFTGRLPDDIELPLAASVRLAAGRDVTVEGGISVNAAPVQLSRNVDSSSAGGDFERRTGTGSGARAEFDVEAGHAIALRGPVSVVATGEADVHVRAPVAVDVGQIAVTAYHAHFSSDSSAQFTERDQYGGVIAVHTTEQHATGSGGNAEVEIAGSNGSYGQYGGYGGGLAGSVVRTGLITVNGPESEIELRGGTVIVDGGGTALIVIGAGGMVDGYGSSDGRAFEFRESDGQAAIRILAYGDADVVGSIYAQGRGHDEHFDSRSSAARSADAYGDFDSGVAAAVGIFTQTGDITVGTPTYGSGHITATAGSGAAAVRLGAGGYFDSYSGEFVANAGDADIAVYGTIAVSGGNGTRTDFSGELPSDVELPMEAQVALIAGGNVTVAGTVRANAGGVHLTRERHYTGSGAYAGDFADSYADGRGAAAEIVIRAGGAVDVGLLQAATQGDAEVVVRGTTEIRVGGVDVEAGLANLTSYGSFASGSSHGNFYVTGAGGHARVDIAGSSGAYGDYGGGALPGSRIVAGRIVAVGPGAEIELRAGEVVVDDPALALYAVGTGGGQVSGNGSSNGVEFDFEATEAGRGQIEVQAYGDVAIHGAVQAQGRGRDHESGSGPVDLAADGASDRRTADVSITTRHGDITVGSPDAFGSVVASASSGEARVLLGAGGNFDPFYGDFVATDAGADVAVYGGIAVSGGGGTIDNYPGVLPDNVDFPLAAQADLAAGGDVRVAQGIAATAYRVELSRQSSSAGDGTFYNNTAFGHGARAQVDIVAGHDVQVGGTITVSGAGEARLHVRAPSVIDIGAVNVTAAEAQLTSYGSFDNGTSYGQHFATGHGGEALVDIAGSSADYGGYGEALVPTSIVHTGPIAAVGPEARIDLRGGTVRLDADGGLALYAVGTGGSISGYGSDNGSAFSFTERQGQGGVRVQAYGDATVIGSIQAQGVGRGLGFGDDRDGNEFGASDAALVGVITQAGHITIGRSEYGSGHITALGSGGAARVALGAGGHLDSYSGAFVADDAASDIVINGGIVVTGGGGTIAGYTGRLPDGIKFPLDARLDLAAGHNVTVAGDIGVHANPAALLRDSAGSFATGSGAHAEANIQAGYGASLGNVSVGATGDAQLNIRAPVFIQAGALTAAAAPAHFNSFGSYANYEAGGQPQAYGMGGTASIRVAGADSFGTLNSASLIQTGPVAATGPEADVNFRGGTVSIGNPGGYAIQAVATGAQVYGDGTSDGAPIHFDEKRGQARVMIDADHDVAVTGAVYLSGVANGEGVASAEAARLYVEAGTGDITIGEAGISGATLIATGGDATFVAAAAQNIEVHGASVTAGDGHSALALFSAGGSIDAGDIVVGASGSASARLFAGADIVSGLVYVTAIGGDAGVLMSAGGSIATGNIDVFAAGASASASADLFAGASIATGNVAITAGSSSASAEFSANTGDIGTGNVTVVSVESEASVDFYAGGNIAVADLYVQGTGASASFTAGADITTGTVSVLGVSNSASASFDAGGDIATGDVTVSGHGETFVDFFAEGNITAGNLNVSAFGSSASVDLSAGGYVHTSNVTVTASGSSADLDVSAGADIQTGAIYVAGTSADASFSAGSTITTGSITITGSGDDAYLRVAAYGDIAVADVTVKSFGGSFASADFVSAYGNIVTGTVSVDPPGHAALGMDAAFGDITMDAVSVNGGTRGARIVAGGAFTVSGSVDLGSASAYATSISLGAGQVPVSVVGSALHAGTIQIAGGSVDLSDTRMSGQDGSAATGVAIDGAAVNLGGASADAGTIDVTASGFVDVSDAGLNAGTDLTITAGSIGGSYASLAAGSDIAIVATGGGISLTDTSATAGGALALDAAGGLRYSGSATAGSFLGSAGSHADLSNASITTTSGALTLDAVGAVLLNDASLFAATDVTVAGGSIQVFGAHVTADAGALSLSGTAVTGSGFTADAGADLTVTASAGPISLPSADLDVGGALTLDAASGLTLSGYADAASFFGSAGSGANLANAIITAATGPLTLVASGGVTLDGAALTASAGNLEVSGTSIFGNGLAATYDTLARFESQSGGISLSNGSIQDAGSPADGTVELLAAQDLVLTDFNVYGGTIVLDAGGSIVLDPLTLDAADSLTVAAEYGSVIASAATLRAATIDVSAGDDIQLDSTSRVDGGVSTFDAGDMLIFGAQADGASFTATAGGAADLSGAAVAADAITVTAAGGITLTGASLVGDTLTVSGTSYSLSDATLRALAGDLALTGTSITGTGTALFAFGTLALTADTIALTGGGELEGGAVGFAASALIDLTGSTLIGGTGAAPFGANGDVQAAIGELPAGVRPGSPVPNVAISAPTVLLGSLALSGDYLFIKSNALSYGGSIAAPSNLLVHYQTFTPNASIGIEQNAGSSRTVNYGVDEHFNVFPGTTFVFGDEASDSQLFVGEAGPVGVGQRATNFVFLSSHPDNLHGTGNVQTEGVVRVLTAFVAPPPDPSTNPDQVDNGLASEDFTTPEGYNSDVDSTPTEYQEYEAHEAEPEPEPEPEPDSEQAAEGEETASGETQEEEEEEEEDEEEAAAEEVTEEEAGDVEERTGSEVAQECR
ncbi:MAG: filamentous hemagglutinin N-terminal domain-containing protein [Gammaproteobacteria bacterium]|nr:filamentous hemagglutinin N-terminal domain-containing protein [Gammaproteobacteria bacterium]